MLALFCTYFSMQGRLIKHLHERWRDFKFFPNTDHIEEFINDVKQSAHQLNDNDVAVSNLINAGISKT